MNSGSRFVAVTAVAFSAVLIWVSSPASAGPITLGSASGFAVLAGSAVTNTGNSVLNGNLGIWPNSASSITGFPSPGTLNGTEYAGDGVAETAQGDLTTAYNSLVSLDGQSALGQCNGSATDLTGSDLGSLGPLAPGVYCFTSSAQLTGTLTLNEQGVTNPEFVFQIGSALTTATDAVVTEVNGGADNNIFWQIGSSATLGTGTKFLGDIVALTSISLDSGASISCGAALAQNGAVTLIDNTISVACPASTTVPEPSTLALVGGGLAGLLGLAIIRRRRIQLA